jgi:hypothetical protein
MDNSDSDDYELMPSHELDDLRHEVTAIKKNSMAEGDKARMLIESMDRLTMSINRFTSILNDAQKDIIDEYQASKPTEKLNQLLEQSETIAKALIAMNENLNNSSRNSQPTPTPTPTPTVDYSALAYSSPNQNYSPQPYAQGPNYNSQGPNYNPNQSFAQGPNYNSPQSYPSGPNFSGPNAYSPAPTFNNMPPMQQQQMQQQPMSQQNQGMTNNSRNAMPIPVPSPTNSQSAGPAFNNQQPTFGPAINMDTSSTGIPDDFPPMEEIPPLEGQTPGASKKKFLGIM